MQETRTHLIEYKVFATGDLERLAEVFERAYQDSSANHVLAHLAFDIDLSNGTSYTSSSREILTVASQETLGDSMRIEAVGMEYCSYDEGKRASLDVSRGNRSYYSALTVRGDDSSWVEGFSAEIEDILNRVKAQKNPLAKHSTAVTFLGTLGIALLFQWIIHSALNQALPPSTFSGQPYRYSLFLSEFIFAVVLAAAVVLPLIDYLKKMWPSVELERRQERTTHL